MKCHELDTGIMDLDNDVIDAAGLAGRHKDCPRELFALGLFWRKNIEPGLVGICDLHVLCQNIEPVKRCRPRRRDRRYGLILLLSDIFCCRGSARLLFCDRIRKMLLAPCFTLLDSLRVGTDCLDIFDRGSGHSHQRLADRENDLSYHKGIVLFDQRIHIVCYSTAKCILLRNHCVIRCSVHDISDCFVHSSLWHHSLCFREKEHSRLFCICARRSEITDRGICHEDRTFAGV